MNTYVDKRIHLCYIYIEMNKKSFIFYISNIILPLLFGYLIYVFTRNTTYINIFLGLSFEVMQNFWTNILSFYVADFLWAYSLFFSLKILWNTITSACLTIFCGTLWECLQISFIKGTFDFCDILMYILAVIIANIILFFWRIKK